VPARLFRRAEQPLFRRLRHAALRTPPRRGPRPANRDQSWALPGRGEPAAQPRLCSACGPHYGIDRRAFPGPSRTRLCGGMRPTILDARPAHIARVQAIYAHWVIHGLASFEETPPEVAEMDRRRRSI